MRKETDEQYIQEETTPTVDSYTDDEETPAGDSAAEASDSGTNEEEHVARPTLKEVIAENAREDERPMSSSLTLRKILGGDILNADAIRRQVWLFLLIALFGVFYISNRYSCQKKQLEIDQLTKKLKTAKYKTLSLSSILTERCRESQVSELLRANKDSVIHPADQPPYIIIVNEN